MHQRKSKKILVYIFLLIIISSINNISLNGFKFDKIQNIKVTGLSIDENKSLLNEIKNLNLNNIFFINQNSIKNVLNLNALVENYEVKKKYPSTIYIKIQKTNFYAKINLNNETFLIGSNGKLSPNDFQNKDLPFIFGKPDIKEFLNFKNIIDQSKFSYNQIENLYFYPSKRWDLKLKNNILLKLSKNLNKKYLNNLYKFLEQDDLKKFTIVDARLKNQFILNE
jgi:cell division protein FtsQ